MARMHARRRGASGSKRPLVSASPKWVPLSGSEIEEQVVQLASQGLTMAKIGLVLRDQYAVPNVRLATGKSVGEILAARGPKSELPEDLSQLVKRAASLRTHLKANVKDLHNARGLHLIEAKIRRLTKYYQRNGILPTTWTYALDRAELQVE